MTYAAPFARETDWSEATDLADFWRKSPETAPAVSGEDGAARGAGYRSGGRNWPMLALIVAIHIALVGALLTAKMTVLRAPPPQRLATFDVITPPAPPAEVPPPESKADPVVAAPQTEIVAPAPEVATPIAAPPVQVARIAPSPVVSPVVVAAAPGPAKAAPAPAPITPPDFNAAQLDNPAPRYPFLSKRAREQGVVTLRVLVTEGGRAGEVKLEDSSGFARLDDAALATVKRWKFLPARQAGAAVAAWVLVPVTFSLT